MTFSKRERFLVGHVFLVLIWVLALRLYIFPEYGKMKQDQAFLWEMQGEKNKIDLYLEHFPEMNGMPAETKETDGFFYQDIDNAFMDRSLQAMAGRAGVEIRRMNIGEPVPVEAEPDGGELAREKLNGEKRVPREYAVMKSVITMDVRSRDAGGVMKFADEVKQEAKSVAVSYMDVKAEYGTDRLGQDTYDGMSGVVEVSYYYEETD